jgi:hypothetical protein
MCFRAVTGVICKNRIQDKFIEFAHQIITINFSDNRSGGNRSGNRVTVNNGFLR